MKAYIVDDDPITIMYATHMLISAGITVRYSLNTNEGLIMDIAKFEPDVIILDLYMPKNSGIEISKKIKSKCKLADIPLVALSSSSELVDKVKAMSSGFIDYIEKPFTKENFISRIRQYGLIGNIFNVYERKKVL